MLVRSALVDLRPFRTGLVVGVVGLMIALGEDHGGALGGVLGGGLAHVVGGAGALIVGVALVLAGRCSSPAPRQAPCCAGRVAPCARRARRRGGRSRASSGPTGATRVVRRHGRARSLRRARRPPLDGVEAYPDVVADGPFSARAAAAPAARAGRRGRRGRRCFDFDTPAPQASTGSRTARCSSRARRHAATRPTSSARTAELLVQALANFGVEATIVGQISGPRVVRYELQLAPGTKVSKVAALKDDLSYALATTEIRILAPIPGKQAVGVEVPNLAPKHRHARRHLRRPARHREPALRLARQGHLRQRRLDRPRAHAAPPDRRHDRLGQVGLHQHAADLDPAPRDAGRRADDPDRPEADRAQLLRVDPAPPDAGRLEPEGGVRRAPQRRRRDGAPLRAALARPRAQPARGEPRLPRARRGRRSRTCSS